jgi:predicted phosphate transport protein (TIGR00153 family)
MSLRPRHARSTKSKPGDDLRRTIETQLYEQTLIPDLRADVLRLLEDLDTLINITQANCYRFTIETPDIPPEYHGDFMRLTENVVACVETVVLSSRAFFRNIDAVRDHNSKVMFYETEADKISTKLKTMAFSSDLPKVEKIHLRYFIERVDELANEAEDIADALAIYTIKRSI